MNVVSRAEPSNPVITALKGYLNGGQKSSTDSAVINLFAAPTTTSASQLPVDESDPFINAMRNISHKYGALSMIGYDHVQLQVTVQTPSLQEFYYEFETKTGNWCLSHFHTNCVLL